MKFNSNFIWSIMTIIGFHFFGYSQCPTINNTNPSICDASGYTFEDLNSNADDLGAGIFWYTAATGGTPFSAFQLVEQGTYYADDNSGTCGTRNSVTVDFVVVPSGENLDGIYCSSENPTFQLYSDEVLASGFPPLGNVEIYYDFDLTVLANPTDPLPLGATNYFIVFVDSGGCKSQIETGSTAVFQAPDDPTPANPQEFCADVNPTIGSLDPGTTSNYSWFNTIDGNGDPIPPALSNGVALINGSTYYVQANDFFCYSNAMPVTVAIYQPIDPGTSAALTYCEDSVPTADFDLFDELGGSPITSGTWTGPIATTNGHLGTVNIAALAPDTYVFTYTVPSNGACPEGNSTVTITIHPIYTSGVPSALNPASFCEADLPSSFDLQTLLDNEDAGGQWNQGLLSTDPVVSSPIDLSGFSPGTYNFTYTQNLSPNPCPEESTTVQVVVLEDPNPGVAINAVFCENDLIANSPYDLFDALDGSQDNNGGTWTDALGDPVVNPIDISGFTMAGNPYTYNYTIDNGTCNATETITITVEPAPESGTATAPVEFCEGAAPSAYDLFDLLTGEDQTGTWFAGTDNTGTAVSNPIDLSGFAAATYNFTYDVAAIGTCDDVLVTVQVIINPIPETGTPTPFVVCENDPVLNTTAFDLFSLLTGEDAGGTWTDDDATGALTANTVDLTGLGLGSFSFTYTITDVNGCTNASTVTIVIEEAPESGTATAPVEFCEGAAPSAYDLFDLLTDEDQTGTWFAGTDNTGTAVTNPIDLSGFAAATYNFTYDVAAIGTCDDVLVTVQVIINPIPETGTPTPFVACENDPVLNTTAFDLFSLLTGEDAGGTWTDDDATGALTGNTVDLTVLGLGSFSFTYTITDVNGCTNASTVTIVIEEAPESGTATAPVEFCEGAAPSAYDLFDLLTGEDQTGTWFAGTDNTGTAVTNPIDLSGFAASTYNFTYDVAAIGTCDDVLVTVQVIINPIPETGTPTPFVVCENDPVLNTTAFDLFSLLTGEDAGGTWTDDDATGALTGNTVDLTVLGLGSFSFTYTITDVNGCTNASTVTIVIEEAPESGTANTPVEFCEGAAPSAYDLFDLLTGEDQTGTWFAGSDNTGTAVTNPIDLSGYTAATYNFTYDVAAIGTCDDVLVTVQVIINPIPNTGIPTPFVVCELDLAANSPLDLFGQLSGNDTGGTWTDDDATGALSGSNVDLTLLSVGSYNFTYTITANGCTNSSTVTITVEDPAEAGTAIPFEICLVDIATTPTLDLFTILTGNDAGGTWSDDDTTGALTGSTVDLTLLTPNTYSFTYLVLGVGSCPNDMETVTIIINETTAPTGTAIQEFCDSATVGDLTATGTNIQWYDDATLGAPLSNGTDLMDGENYFATQTDATTGCESSIRFEVTVNIYASPNSGNLSATPISICTTNTSVDLNDGLDGTQDVSGTWLDTDSTGALTGSIFDATSVPVGTYQFTYDVTATSPCIDASTVIMVTVEDPVNAGTDNVLDICSTNASVDLFALLGTADAGGTWSPALSSGTNIFDPLVDADGTYTYNLVNGCSSDSSEIIITVTQAPNAGSDNATTLCVVDGSVDLFTLLNGTPDATGTWSPPLTSGTGVFDPEVDTAGIFTYTVLSTAPCTTDASAQITLTVSNSVAPTVIDATPSFCLADNPTVADLNTSVSGSTINWYEDNTSTTPLNSSTALIDNEDYFATQTGNSNCESSLRIQVMVTINDTATPTLTLNGNAFCINDSPTLAELTANINEYDSGSNTIVWYDAETGGTIVNGNSFLDNGNAYYAVLVDPITGCESSMRLLVIPDLTACGTLFFPDGFSPNGDGINDTFTIDNLDFLFPDYNIEIYNRNGSVVYQGNVQKGPFAGKSNQSRLVSKGDLPVGVYFYIVNFNDGTTKPKQGNLYLSR